MRLYRVILIGTKPGAWSSKGDSKEVYYRSMSINVIAANKAMAIGKAMDSSHSNCRASIDLSKCEVDVLYRIDIT